MNESKKKALSQSQEDDAFDLLPKIRAVIKKWWLILLLSILCAELSFIVAKYLIPPKYQASFSAYVNNTAEGKQPIITSSDISASISLANTYSKIITSRTVLLQAAQKINCDLSLDELKRSVEVKVGIDTEIITVLVTTTDPQLSKDLAYSIYSVATDVGAATVEASSMRAFEMPVYPEGIYSPQYGRVAIIAFAIGFLLSCLSFLLYEFFDNRVKSQESLEERFNLVVLGSVPNFSRAFSNDNDAHTYRYSEPGEAGGKKHA